MNFPFYIARRYLVSKKSHNIINIISAISVAGVCIGTMAIIIVLSVFNGFEKLVISLFNSFNPDLQITINSGKTFTSDSFPEDRVRRIPGVRYLTEVIEENALIKYKDKQYIVTMKGVSDDYQRMCGIDSMMSVGKFVLQDGEKNLCVLGYGVAYYLGANIEDYQNPLTFYVPKRTASFSAMSENAFNSAMIFPSGFFSIQEDFDSKYVILPLRFVKNLMEYSKEVTSIEVGITKGSDPDKIRKSINRMAGNNWIIKDRFQQQEVLYKIMKSEKWAIFLILSFILFIATFNVIGSLSMLILDKKKDIAILQSMGATQPLIKKIFLFEGTMISFSGAIAGLFLGGILCWLQQIFGFIRLGSAGSSFVVSSYPVHMQMTDFLFVFLIVIGIGFMAVWYPVYNIRKLDITAIYQRS
jgi:lipoprotein-releasing system permease protein